MSDKQAEGLGLHGHWTVTRTKPGTRKFGPHTEIFDDDGRLTFRGYPVIDPGEIQEVIEGENLIVTVGKAFLGNFMIDLDAQHDVGLTYCALGSDNTAPAVAQTQLVDEGGGAAMRNAVTSKTQAVAPNTNQFTWSIFFTAAQSTLAIEEAGMFGSSTAGAAENSGIMFSRWLVSINNAGATSDVTLDYTLTIA